MMSYLINDKTPLSTKISNSRSHRPQEFDQPSKILHLRETCLLLSDDMTGSRSACLLCRYIVATKGGARIPQWQNQVSQFSTTFPSRSDDRTVTATTQEPYEYIPPKVAADRPEPIKVRRIVPSERRTPSTINWSQKKPRKPPTQSPARVDALFQEIISQQTESKDAAAQPTSRVAYMDLALVKAIGELELMIERGESEADAFSYLKTNIYPLLQEPDITIPKVFDRVVSRLMKEVVAAKKQAMRSPELPTVAEIFRVYVDIGEMKPQEWAALVGELVKIIVGMDSSAGQQEPSTDDEGLVTRDAMLADLVDCWKVLTLPKVIPSTPDKVTDGFWFPRPDKFSLKRFSDKGNFPAALSSIFPHYRSSHLGAPVAVLAIATYALLLDPQRSNPDVRQSAARFIAKIAYLITFVNFRDAALKSQVRNHFPELENYVMAQWPIIKEQLRQKIESINAAQAQPRESSHSTNSGGINEIWLGRSLSWAYMTKNYDAVDRLWLKFIGSSEDIPEERAVELRKHPDLFDSFINVRMAMNQPNYALDALNILRKVGLKPTLKTWNTMLDGCKTARNLNGLKNIWAKVAGSGMKLDTKIWTARVSGLIECGDVDGGIQALKEMVSAWNESSKDENATAVRPTIAPVNAALVGLTRQDRVGAAEALLAWAGRQGIEPDVFTYNILLRRFVRDGRSEDVRRLLTTMRDTGVRADEATFTIVLDAAFERIPPDDVEQQDKTVASVLAEMKAAGLEANLHTYGKMIYNLLRSGDRALEVIKAVLAHLWSQGYELSPHIYTMLVEHYFARRPPDLNAVESLLQRRRLLDFDDTDNIFFDRVIKGYCLVGQLDKALEIYYKLSDTGISIILATQIELLRALLDRGRTEDARALVANTKRMFIKSYRSLDNVETAGFWGHPFWKLASYHGIFDWEGVGDAATAPQHTSSQGAGSTST
ncbi:hypothetical protein F5Y05DRAFT_407314 [Hypoxylon sp. FL0543]|nr:hypothetical protein F5Y05DRAFT_407314 [Hypoxylon sp. FL0543]